MILIQLNSALRKEKKEKNIKIWLHIQKRKKKLKEAVTGERLHAYYIFLSVFCFIFTFEKCSSIRLTKDF